MIRTYDDVNNNYTGDNKHLNFTNSQGLSGEKSVSNVSNSVFRKQ